MLGNATREISDLRREIPRFGPLSFAKCNFGLYDGGTAGAFKEYLIQHSHEFDFSTVYSLSI
jgi:hypothetical protein